MAHYASDIPVPLRTLIASFALGAIAIVGCGVLAMSRLEHASAPVCTSDVAELDPEAQTAPLMPAAAPAIALPLAAAHVPHRKPMSKRAPSAHEDAAAPHTDVEACKHDPLCGKL